MRTNLKAPALMAELWRKSALSETLGAPGSFARDQKSASQLVSDAADRLELTFVGSAARRTIEETLQPGSYMPRERANRNGRPTIRRGPGAGRAAIFRGRAWDEVTVVPFEVTQGQICGFAFADSDVTRPADYLFRSYARRAGGLKEAGLAMLASAHARTARDLQDWLLIMLDLTAALQLQYKQSRCSLSPFPVVVPCDDDRHRTVEAWRHIPQRERILLSASADARTFRQARLADAKLVVSPDLIDRIKGPPASCAALLLPELETALRYTLSPLALMRILRQSARTWTAVLQTTLGALEPAAALNLLRSAGMPLWEQHEFLKRSPYAIQQKLKRAGDPHLLAPRVLFSGQSVVERDGAWFEEPSGAKISEIVRVSRILKSTVGDAWVEGHVLRGGVDVPFRLREVEVKRRGLLAGLKKEFQQQGKEFNYRRGWSKRSFTIATGLHKPHIIDRADAVGWDSYVLRFPTFGTSKLGFAADLAVPLKHGGQPAQELTIPRPIVRPEVRPITIATPDAALFWAVMRLVVLYATGPAYRRAVPSCALIGNQAPLIAAALSQSLGCLTHLSPCRSDAHKPLRALTDKVKRHAWPAIVQMPESHRSAGTLLAGLAPGQSHVGCLWSNDCIKSVPVNPPHGVAVVSWHGGLRCYRVRRQLFPSTLKILQIHE